VAAKWESRNYLAALVAGTALLAAAGSGAASGAANASEDTPVAAATKAPPFLNRTFAIVRCPNLPQFFPKGARQTTALSPHRKSTPTKRKKRKWAAKTKGENNISDAAAAKSAIEQKSTALFSSSSSLCFTRAVVAGLRRVAHTVGYCRAPSSILPKRRKAASKNLLHRRSVFTVSNSTEPHSLLIRRSSSHPTIACTTVTYAVGLN